MMRICHVVRQYHPGVGGLEGFVGSLARSLSDIGCQNDVLTLDRVFRDAGRRLPAAETIDGIKVKRVPMLGHRRFFLPLIPTKALKRYDVIHVHGIDGMFDNLALRRREPAQVLAATTHGLFFHTPWMRGVKHAYLNTATRFAARRYDLMIANSASDLARIRSVRENVLHLPNGITPLGDFQAQGRDLLCLGRLAQHKHVERVIAAMAEPEMDGVVLHVVGPEWDVSHVDLARAAEHAGVGDRVRLHGRVSQTRLREIARSCGLIVSASSYEGFGMSLIEGMSVGLAPVAEPNASFSEIIAQAGCGSLADFADPQCAARAMRRELDKLDTGGRKHAIAFARRYSWPHHAQRTLELYHRAARARRARLI